MSRSLLIGAAAIAAATFAPVAMAQDGSITVSGPRLENAERSSKGVHPTQMVVSEVAVATHDLDLRTSYGRDVLDHRVEMAAREVCSRIDDLYRSGGLAANPVEESADCRVQARKSAEAQVRAALWARG